ncbi:MAG: hypothetical protein ACRDSR_06110 [Pseudonocardiaceae bacterium]
MITSRTRTALAAAALVIPLAGVCLGLDSTPVAFSEVVRGTGMTSLP